ncbi:Sperm flagellar protein 1 [Bulinus truncatus]|nr:Sperm flagellar protein 1 [Bulinus truncatus]
MKDFYDAIELENLYQWIDSIPFSRPKNNIGKDFSDAVLVAEIIKYYFPCLLDVSNYPPAISPKHKMENWYLLNRKVLCHLGIDLSEEIIRALANCKQNVVEKLLMILRYQIDKYIEKYGAKSKTWHNKNNHKIERRHIVLKTARTQSCDSVTSSLHKSQPSNAPIIDNVPLELLEEKMMEYKAKTETIQILTVKIKKMEHLLHLKEVKIQELEKHIQEKSVYTKYS